MIACKFCSCQLSRRHPIVHISWTVEPKGERTYYACPECLDEIVHLLAKKVVANESR